MRSRFRPSLYQDSRRMHSRSARPLRSGLRRGNRPGPVPSVTWSGNLTVRLTLHLEVGLPARSRSSPRGEMRGGRRRGPCTTMLRPSPRPSCGGTHQPAARAMDRTPGRRVSKALCPRRVGTNHQAEVIRSIATTAKIVTWSQLRPQRRGCHGSNTVSWGSRPNGRGPTRTGAPPAMTSPLPHFQAHVAGRP